MIRYWEFTDALESEYHLHRKQVMERFDLSAVEVDVMLFLANNPQYKTAADVSRMKKIPKSHVSLAVKGLIQKRMLRGEPDAGNRKRIRLVLTQEAAEMITYGRQQQEHFVNVLFRGFSPEEAEQYHSYCARIMNNVHNNQKEEQSKHVQRE